MTNPLQKLQPQLEEVIDANIKLTKLVEKMAAQIAWCTKEIYEMKMGKEWG